MRANFQSLGYWMRRSTGFTDAELVPYYTDVVGLPLMRVGPDVSLLWGGEDIVFEIKTQDEPGMEGSAWPDAPLLPIFRTHDLDATRDRFTQAGITGFVNDATDFSERIWVRGPDGLLVGFESRDPLSPFAADVEALRRWQDGVPSLAGVPALPAELQYLSRVRRAVSDVDRAANFYRDVVGLNEVGRESDAILFGLGDTVMLELVPGGRARPTPHNRMELIDSFIFRVHGFDECVAQLSKDGAEWVGEQIRYSTGSNLAYFADPEGGVIGIEERSSYGDYPDDIESARRWLSR